MVLSHEDDKLDGGVEVAGKSPSMLRNFLNLLTGRFVGDLGTFLLFVALSRSFGEEGIGQYSFATVVGGIAFTLTDFGLRTYTMKEVGRHRHGAKDRYWEVIATWLINSVITLAIMIPVVLLVPMSADSRWILILIGSSQIFLGILTGFAVFFVAHERMEIGAFYETAASWLVALSAIAVIFSGGQLVAVSATIAIAYLVAALVAAAFAFRFFRITRGPYSFAIYRLRMREAAPFGLRHTLRQVSMRMDILFIGVLLGASQVGAYAVAYRLVFMLFLIFNLVGTAILPASSRFFKESRAHFLVLAQRSMGVTVLLSLPGAVGLLLVAPEVIELIFGAEFEASAGLLQGLSVIIIIFPVGLVIQNLLDSCDRQTMTMISEAVGVTIGVIAHSILIPLFGLEGAVAAAIITEVAVVATAMYGFRDFINWPRLTSRLGISALGSGAFALLFFALPGVSVFILIPAAVVIYGAVVVCFRDVREQELAILMQLLRKRRG